MRLIPCITLPACCVVVATEHLARASGGRVRLLPCITLPTCCVVATEHLAGASGGRVRLLPCITLPACCVVVATEHLAGDFYHVLHHLHVVLLLLQNISLERLEAV